MHIKKTGLLIALAIGSATAFAQIPATPGCAMTKAASNAVASKGALTQTASDTDKASLLLSMLAYEAAAAREPGCDDRNGLDRIGDKAYMEQLAKSLHR